MIAWLWIGIMCQLTPIVTDPPVWLNIVLTIGWFISYFAAYILWDIHTSRIRKMHKDMSDLRYRVTRLEQRDQKEED